MRIIACCAVCFVVATHAAADDVPAISALLSALESYETSIATLRVEYRESMKQAIAGKDPTESTTDYLWARQGSKEFLAARTKDGAFKWPHASYDGKNTYEIVYDRAAPAEVQMVRISTGPSKLIQGQSLIAAALGWRLPLAEGSISQCLRARRPRNARWEMVGENRCVVVDVAGVGSDHLPIPHTMTVAFDEAHEWLPRKIEIVPDDLALQLKRGGTAISFPKGGYLWMVETAAFRKATDQLSGSERWFPAEVRLRPVADQTAEIRNVLINQVTDLPVFTPEIPPTAEVITDYGGRKQASTLPAAKGNRDAHIANIQKDQAIANANPLGVSPSSGVDLRVRSVQVNSERNTVLPSTWLFFGSLALLFVALVARARSWL